LSSLETILKKRNLAPAKLDEIKIKHNILRAFTEPLKEEEKVEEAEEAKRDTAEL
jgi:protein disulfide-isomerase A6